MNWTTLISNPHFLHALYGPEGPPLSPVRIGAMELRQDGPRLTLFVTLPTYPEKPPVKWKGCNTAVLELDCSGVTSFAQKGWAWDNVGTLSLTGKLGEIALTFTSPGCVIEAGVSSLYVQRISAHLVNASNVE